MKLTQKLSVNYIRTKFKVLSSISKKKTAEKAFELFCTPQSRITDKFPPVFDESEKINFDLDGFKVRGYRWNHPAQKKVLILHGFESSVINFDRYIKSFIKKGYEVLAFDAPGHGKSTGKMITAPLYIEMILEINKRYGPVQSFVAHSLGGLTLCLALEEIKHDDRCRVVLIAPATETSSAIDAFFHYLKLDAEVRKEFEKMIINKGGKSSAWYSISRAVKNLKARILWFHDLDDETTPVRDTLKVKAENHPNIQFVITKGLGHSRIYRDSEVIKQTVDFL
jgi:pimeloyl-ACP methyl ester carboxylesterase